MKIKSSHIDDQKSMKYTYYCERCGYSVESDALLDTPFWFPHKWICFGKFYRLYNSTHAIFRGDGWTR